MEIKFQIGKSGLTEGIIESLRLAFKNHKQVRISVLKSAGRDKPKVIEMAEEISSKLKEGQKEHAYPYRVIGFTIAMRRGKST